MLDALLNSVLPIFAILAVGMGFARAGLFELSHAQAINRFVFYVGVPVLNFHLLAQSDPGHFDWALLGFYVVAELSIYLAGLFVFRRILGRGWAESMLLSLALIFCNHVFCVLPIGIAAFGDGIAPAIIATITVDILIFFGGTAVAMEVLDALETHRDEGRLFFKIARQLLTHPLMLAILLGLLAMAFRLPLDNGFGLFLDFVGNGAAPASLFALGIILVSHRAESGWGLVAAIVAVNLIGMPVVMSALMAGPGAWFGGFDLARAAPALLVAAGPVGAMPFVLAVQYGHESGTIGRAILVATILSVFSLSAVIAFIGVAG